MRAIQKISIAAILAIGTAGVGLVSVAQGQEHQAIVAERLALMKNIGKHFGAIKKAAGAGDAVQVESNARDIAKLSRSITGLFPPGTSPDKVRTRAKPDVWTNWAGFVAASDTLGQQAAKLAQVAKGGDKAATMAQFGQTGKLGCGGCHSKFRGPKLK